LIESAIGSLGLASIANQETHPVLDRTSEIRNRLLVLQSAINGAPSGVRSSRRFIENLVAILKSTEVTCAPEFIVFLGRKYPKIMMDMIDDVVIKNRIHHLYLVMELNECFSESSVRRLNSGIDGVRKKVFNLSNRSADLNAGKYREDADLDSIFNEEESS
jgi:hypothetical protein